MYCSKCGKEIDDTSVFCKYCGANQNSEPAAAPIQNPSPAQTSASSSATAGISSFFKKIEAIPFSGEPQSGLTAEILSRIPGIRITLYWRILSCISAFLLVFHGFGLWFGKFVSMKAYKEKARYFSFSSLEDLEDVAFHGFTSFVLVVGTLALIAGIAFAAYCFNQKKTHLTLLTLGSGFIPIILGKIMLLFLTFSIESYADSSYLIYLGIKVQPALTLIISIIICIAMCLFMIMTSIDMKNYQEKTGKPAQASAPANISMTPPSAPVTPADNTTEQNKDNQ